MLLLAGITPGYGSVTAAAVGAPLSEGQRALEEAAESGQRVEIAGERSEFTTTYANPDGETFHLVQSTVPVRAKTESGEWVKADATLEVRPDGSVGPKAAIVGLSFSGGGATSDLVEIERDGRTLGLRWPKPLPKPVLDGASATYPEVLPGVDLRMTATTEGFRELLVVKTPQAAANPELKAIKFPLKTNGLEVSGSKENGLTAWNSDGQAVFKAPPALMWDSSGPEENAAAQPQAKAARMTASSMTTEDDPATPSAAGEESPFDGPGLGDQTAGLPLEVTASSLTVVPDTALLTQNDASAFPLYIDPSINADESVERLLLRSDGYEDYAWENGEDKLGKGMGKCGSWAGYYCGPGYVQRLYFQFTPEKLRGKRILDATFRVTEPWAFQCEVRNVWLVRTAGRFTKSTTWSTKPGYKDLMGDRWVSAGRGSLCDPDAPAAPIEFHDNPAEPDENLTPTVQAWATGTAPLTLELRAEDESDTSAWKRFRNDAAIEVDYISNPAVPTGQSVDGTPCETDPDEATTISRDKPDMKATAKVYPGGEDSARLKVAFLVERKDGTNWVKANDGLFIDSPAAGPTGANQEVLADRSLMPTLRDGETYRVHTWTRSFAVGAATAGSSRVTCYFKVDTSAPKAPRVSFGSPYVDCTNDDSCPAAGRPGLAGRFTFRPAEGEGTEIVKYKYKVSGDTTWTTVPATSSWPIAIEPREPGLNYLQVVAFDAVNGGRMGITAKFRFAVAEDPDPIAHWNFHDMSGGDAQDTASNDFSPDPADLRNGATQSSEGRRGWLANVERDDRALQLDGVDDYAATSGPVIDTQESFTIAGWVRPDRVDKTFSMAAVAGEHTSAVSITHSDGRWSAMMRTADTSSDSVNTFMAVAKEKTVPKVWTHVAAVYDKPERRLRLYINGDFQEGVDLVAGVSPFEAKGSLIIGRNKHRDDYVNALPGLVDEVTVWQADLKTPSLKAAAQMHDKRTGRNMVELSARWNPDGASGSTVTDTSGYGRNLILSSGTTIAGGKLVLDGVTDSGWASGPLVDELGSFTATAEVELDSEKLSTKPDGYVAQVLGQRYATGAAWGVWFKKESKTTHDPNTGEEITQILGNWYFGYTDSSGNWTESPVPAELDSSVQLTVIHDAQSGEKAQDGRLKLYVDGEYVSDREPFVATTSGSTTFAVGKGFVNGAWSNYLPGRINDVRLWSGAMHNEDQVKDFT